MRVTPIVAVDENRIYTLKTAYKMGNAASAYRAWGWAGA